jgi:biopolymer transport protein ExbD
MSTNNSARTKPFINVTPLIDVLLVMLIIFMVVAPQKPHSFAAKLPAPSPRDLKEVANIHTLVVTVQPDRTLKLNSLTTDMGSVEDPAKLSEFLVALFAERRRNHAYREEMITRTDLPEERRIQKTVFIKAPRGIPYGEVTKVIDALKGAGAEPVGLQLDALN